MAAPPTSVALLALALVAAAAGCSSSSDDAASTTTRRAAASTTSTTTTSTTAPAAVAAAFPAGCAWRVRADKATLNIAYPDTAATYWATRYRLAEGQHLEVAGDLPTARYASFISYRADGAALDTISDRDLTVTGGANPFAGESGGPGRFRATITTDPAAQDDPAAAHTEADGSVIYRVYLPRPASDRTGGAGLPTVTLVDADGTRTAVPTCAKPGATDDALKVVETKGPPTDRPAPSTPIFLRPDNTGSGLFPNPDNVYVATILHHTPGKIVVVHGKAPTFPDTGAGDPITGTEQVRYWSICSNEYRKPYPVSSCLADEAIPLDDQGRYTIVVATPEDRPAHADAAHDAAWLRWGSTDHDVLLLVRNMLADPDFAESATRLAPGALAVSSMGAYAPTGAICTPAQFDAGDAACG